MKNLLSLDGFMHYFIRALTRDYNLLKNQFKKENTKYIKRSIILVVFLFFIVLYKDNAAVFLPLSMVALHAALKFVSTRTALSYFGIDIGFFSAIMIGYLYGSKSGFFFGILLFLAYIMGQIRFRTSNLLPLILYPLLGLIASIFSEISIIGPGIVLYLVTIIIYYFIAMFLDKPMPIAFLWCLGNLILTVWLFLNIAPLLIMCCSV